MNSGLSDTRQKRCERRPVHMRCVSHARAPLTPVFERQATCVPWDVGHFAQCQGPWPEHGVHGRAAALFMGSGAVSRRQSKPSVRGPGAVTRGVERYVITALIAADGARATGAKKRKQRHVCTYNKIKVYILKSSSALSDGIAILTCQLNLKKKEQHLPPWDPRIAHHRWR